MIFINIISNNVLNPLIHLFLRIFKVIWSTLQIIGTISWNLSIKFPYPFSEFLALLSFLQFDWLSLDCVSGENSFKTRVYVISFTPIAIAALIVVVWLVRRSWVQRQYQAADDGGGIVERDQDTEGGSGPPSEHAKAQARIRAQHCYLLLLGSYLVLPPCSMALFQALNCETMAHDGSSFLRSDSGISCDSLDYKEFQIVVILLVVVYQSIPFIWLWNLWCLRHRLNPSPVGTRTSARTRNEKYSDDTLQTLSQGDHRGDGSSSSSSGGGGGGRSGGDRMLVALEERRDYALRKRSKDDGIAFLSFLFWSYHPDYYYFEVIEMWRRVLFVGVIPLLGRSELCALAGCVFSVFFAFVAREATPCREEATNVLLAVGNFQILACFLAALVILTDLLGALNLSDLQCGALLVAANSAILVVTAFWCVRRWRRDEERRAWLRDCHLTERERILVQEVMAGNYSGSSSTVQAGTVPDDFYPTESKGSYLEMTPRAKTSDGTAKEMGAKEQLIRSNEADERKLLEQVLLPPSSVRLEQRIGAGAFGEVFKGALHGAPCAVKTMKQPVSKDAVVAFRKEILISSQLRHPNVVEFKGACWGGDLTCLILGWCSRGSLDDLLLDKTKDLHWAEPLLRLTTDIARGMRYLHGRRFFDEMEGTELTTVLHRDLKVGGPTFFISPAISPPPPHFFFFFIFPTSIPSNLTFLCISPTDVSTHLSSARTKSTNQLTNQPTNETPSLA